MSLKYLYAGQTGSLNPPGSGNLPGGAGVLTAGGSANPGISAPRLEEEATEVYDVTAPTTLSVVSGATTLPTPAASGKLLVMSPITGAFGARWKLNSTQKQQVARGQYGIVFTAGASQTTLNNDAGPAVGTSAGNEATFGTKAVIYESGPIQAFCETTVGGVAISAGMPLQSDGAGNLTAYSYAATSGSTFYGPLPGSVLAIAAGNVASSVSIPALINVFVGDY